MVQIDGNTITVTRGDTLEVPVYISTTEGEAYVPAPGDKIRFAVKSKYNDESPLIVKTIPNDRLTLRLEASETGLLPSRRKPYVYDIELRSPGNTVVDTFLTGELYITEEVC